MLVLNRARRLISINVKDLSVKDKGYRSYDLRPAGDPVEIPDEILAEHPYVALLEASGDIQILSVGGRKPGKKA